MSDFADRLNSFLQECSSKAYYEVPSELHTQLTKDMWERVKPLMNLPIGSRVLDVGCGAGCGIEVFLKEGLDPFGITMVKDEVIEIRKKFPHPATRAGILEMHRIGEFDHFYDLIWMRHSAEHSIAPAFLLHEAHVALKDGGFIYLEVPGSAESGSMSCHETNESHFSVMGSTMWLKLLERAGFKILDSGSIQFATGLGPEFYHFFLGKK